MSPGHMVISGVGCGIHCTTTHTQSDATHDHESFDHSATCAAKSTLSVTLP